MNDTGNSPLVSVIIPNYNHSRYLDRRIKSVLNQTYKNIEVIILDDHSIDNSVEVIQRYLSDPRISNFIINEVNSGNTFFQWKRGFSYAKGSIVWIAESDDYADIHMLEELVRAYFHKPNTVLAYTTNVVVDENENEISYGKAFRNKYVSSDQFLKRYLSLENCVRNASSAIFSREVALSVDDSYINYRGAGDYLFWVRIALRGNVAIVSKNLNYFRRHSGTVTGKRNSDGSNYFAEVSILQEISNHVMLSSIRKVLVYTHHCKRISWDSFDSDEIRKSVVEAWDYDKYQGIFCRYLWWFTCNLRGRLNIYL